MTTTTSGPDFVSFQVRDREASARFYEELVGLRRLAAPNPAAAVFSAGDGATFAVRDPLPGLDLDATDRLGVGVSVWFPADDVTGVHARLVAAGVPIVQEPFEGPFGTQLSFRDPDGYVVTVHAAA